jgi:hypothetical protein
MVEKSDMMDNSRSNHHLSNLHNRVLTEPNCYGLEIFNGAMKFKIRRLKFKTHI